MGMEPAESYRGEIVARDGKAVALRVPGERICHPGERICYPGERIRHPGERIRYPGERIRHPGERIRHPGESRGPASDWIQASLAGGEMTRRAGHSIDEAAERIRELAAWKVFAPTADNVLIAIALEKKATSSFWDAQVVRGVRIRNPFLVSPGPGRRAA